jgi:RNA recognition motif-containing protein
LHTDWLQVTEEDLAGFFAACGPVVDCRICGDPNSAMRFAFLEFNTLQAAKNVSGGVRVR